jgi:hypothetical protein
MTMIDLSILFHFSESLGKLSEALDNAEDAHLSPKEKEKLAKVKERFIKNRPKITDLNNKIKGVLFDLNDLFKLSKDSDEERDKKQKTQQDLFLEYLQDLISTLMGRGLTLEQIEKMAMMCQDPSTALKLLWLDEDTLRRRIAEEDERKRREAAEYAKQFQKILDSIRNMDVEITQDYSDYYARLANLDELRLKQELSEIEITGLTDEIHALESKIKTEYPRKIAELKAGIVLLNDERSALKSKLDDIAAVEKSGQTLKILKSERIENNNGLAGLQSRLTTARNQSEPLSATADLEQEIASSKEKGIQLDKSISSLETFLESKKDLPRSTEEKQSIWDKYVKVDNDLGEKNVKLEKEEKKFEKIKPRYEQFIDDKKKQVAKLKKEHQERGKKIEIEKKQLAEESKKIKNKEKEERKKLDEMRKLQADRDVPEDQLFSDSHIKEREIKNKETELAQAEELRAKWEKEGKGAEDKLKKAISRKTELENHGTLDDADEVIKEEVDAKTKTAENLKAKLAEATQKKERIENELQQLKRDNARSPAINSLADRVSELDATLTRNRYTGPLGPTTHNPSGVSSRQPTSSSLPTPPSEANNNVQEEHPPAHQPPRRNRN